MVLRVAGGFLVRRPGRACLASPIICAGEDNDILPEMNNE
jgi:hypothetical protein